MHFQAHMMKTLLQGTLRTQDKLLARAKSQQLLTMALFCFMFNALLSRKFMPLSSSESELESVAEFSEGWGGATFFLLAPLPFLVGNFSATRSGPGRLPWLRVPQRSRPDRSLWVIRTSKSLLALRTRTGGYTAPAQWDHRVTFQQRHRMNTPSSRAP